MDSSLNSNRQALYKQRRIIYQPNQAQFSQRLSAH